MSKEKNRPACISDLKAYFRKLDLLGGLTEIEKGQLRKNIGVVGYDEQGGQLIQKRTYQSLLTDVKEKLIKSKIKLWSSGIFCLIFILVISYLF